MPSLLQNLRETNQRMTYWLDGMAVQPGQPPFVVTPETMEALLSELLRTGGWLRVKPLPAKASDPALESELEKYRHNVEKLSRLLPSIHSQLLAEQARLEAQRTRLRSAAEWARASRQGLRG